MNSGARGTSTSKTRERKCLGLTCSLDLGRETGIDASKLRHRMSFLEVKFQCDKCSFASKLLFTGLENS